MKLHDTVVSNRDVKMLSRAVALSQFSDCKFKHGAIIQLHGKTVAVGVNSIVNDPNNLEDCVAVHHAAIHAEVAALNACRKVNLRGATVFVARTLNSGEPRISKPCSNCEKALRERGVKRVVYTTSFN